MLVASDDATSGSLIAKAERISPASNRSSLRWRCSAVPIAHHLIALLSKTVWNCRATLRE